MWKFDRFSRSVTHLLESLKTFQRLKVEFVSITDSIDTSTPMGKMVFTFLGAVAEFERALICNGSRQGWPQPGRRARSLDGQQRK